MFSWLRRFSAPGSVVTRTPSTAHRLRPECEALEDRATPTVSAIASNFNGTAIPAGDSLWFSSVAKVSGVPANGATIHVADQAISFTANGVQYSYQVPDTTVVLSPTATQSQISTDGAGNWDVTTPEHFSGNVFLAGLAVPLPNGLPGGIKNVTWSGDFTTDTTGVKVNWQWAAAVYTQLGTTDAGVLGVKPSDSPTSIYPNSDHAGTPENFKTDVTGGATGGGGSNWTGSYSGTAAVVPNVATQSPSTLSGNVKDGNGNPMANVQITLTGTNSQNQTVTLTTKTDSMGNYSFSGLLAGNYIVTEQPPLTENGSMYLGSQSFPGEIDGSGSFGNANGTSISSISLGSGSTGTQFDFVNDYGVVT